MFVVCRAGCIYVLLLVVEVLRMYDLMLYDHVLMIFNYFLLSRYEISLRLFRELTMENCILGHS